MTDITNILSERAKTHGSFVDNATSAQGLKNDARIYGTKWLSLKADQRESIDMIMHKIARIINGNCNEPDHWNDIAGYALLVANRLEADSYQADAIASANSSLNTAN